MLNKAELNIYLNVSKKLESKVDDILNTQCKIQDENSRGYKGTIEKIEIENETVEVTTVESSGCSCCPDESHYYNFPLSRLFDDSWVEEAKAKAEQTKALRLEKARHEKVIVEKLRSEREFAEYQRLQAKFGNDNPAPDPQ